MKNFLASVFVVSLFMILGGTALAQLGTTPAPIVNVDFPCPGNLGLGPCAPVTDISSYLNNLYKFGLGVAGLLALGMIVAGGVYYTVSSGSSDKQREAKDMITSAILGLILLFASYLILYTINPQIVSLNIAFTTVGGNAIKPYVTSTPGNILPSNKCADFKNISLDPPVSTSYGSNCSNRTNILSEDASINAAGNYYGSVGNFFAPKIDKGDYIWTYPYFLKSGPDSAHCLIYAYRKPEASSSIEMVEIKSDVELCAPQGQNDPTSNIKCALWSFTALGSSEPLNPRCIPLITCPSTTDINVNLQVNDGFNYPDVGNPPPYGVSNINCPPGVNFKYCYSGNWSCSAFKQ